jgi:hypothetical protein
VPTDLSTVSTTLVCDPIPCATVADCPGQDSGCAVRACVAGSCTLAFAASGTPAPMQTAGDCHVNECDGTGGTATVVDNTDVPVPPACQVGSCTAGQPLVAPSPVGGACSTNPAMVCNGTGSCVQCNVPTDCGGQDATCAQRACVANACTQAFAPELTACTDSGGTICDGAGDCIPVTFAVSRIGSSGTAVPITASAAVFVERRGVDGSLANTVQMPTAAAGTNNPLTLTGGAVSEGALARSANGRYVTLAGYATGTGVAGVVTAPNTNRVVARIGASSMVDTSTLIGSNFAFSGQNVRGVVSDDGTHFWVSGLGGGSTGGLVYVPLGNTATAAPVFLSMNQFRVVEIFGGKLFGDGEASGTILPPEVFQIDTTLPTSGTPALNELPGMPTGLVPSPWQFVFFDLNPAVPGFDTLYVANDKAVGSGSTTLPNGIQKWTFDGTNWNFFGTLNGLTTAPSPSGFRGLAGIAQGQTVTLMATTVDTLSSFNRIAVFVDPNAATTNYTTLTPPTGTVVVTAPANELYRGVAFWPHP